MYAELQYQIVKAQQQEYLHKAALHAQITSNSRTGVTSITAALGRQLVKLGESLQSEDKQPFGPAEPAASYAR